MNTNYNKQKNNKYLKISVILLSILTIIILILQLISSIPKKELISTESYDVYELKIRENEANSYYEVYYSYLDNENKIIQKKIYAHDLFNIIYLSEKNQITIEYYGRNGKISKNKLVKFHITDEKLKEFAKTFNWEFSTN